MSTRRLIILDLETVPAPWAPPPEQEGFPELPAHLPVVIGWLCVDLEPGKPAVIVDRTEMGEPGERWERAALLKLGDDIKGAGALVTYNGRGFDMPLLQLRALALAVPWEFWESKRHRFPAYQKPLFHLDMYDQLGDFGAARNLSLDGLAHMCGLAGKGGMHGSRVKDEWAAGEHEKVRRYCVSDLVTTLQVYLRFLWMRGDADAGDVKRWLGDVGVWVADLDSKTTLSEEEE